MKVLEGKIKVSIICITYNHAPYIRDALNSFLMQKTNFSFEILVHDDASTDGTAEIVREYEKKFPDIVKGIYQSENKYSQGVKIIKTYLFPIAKGEYIAFCEGDDYWTNENKLQLQVDFLDRHQDYSACVHRTVTYDQSSGKKYVYRLEKDRDLSITDILISPVYHTSSLIFRNEFIEMPTCMDVIKGAGDFQRSIHLFMSGKIRLLSNVMSLYRKGVAGSWTLRLQDNKQRAILHQEQMVCMLRRAKDYYHRYESIFDYAIYRAECTKYLLMHDAYNLFHSEAYKRCPFSRKCKLRVAFYFPRLYHFCLYCKRELKTFGWRR